MMYQSGPSHCLKPEYWQEWAAQYGLSLAFWAQRMAEVEASDAQLGFKTVYDLTPDDLHNDYLSAYRAVVREELQKWVRRDS